MKKGALMVFVYVLLFVIVVPVIGKLVNRRSDAAYKRTARWGSMAHFRFSRFHVDPEENPRPVDDGTQYGYKEFD
jgi:Na+-transporting methylmalonyl-CoA/oxaloacetate decarboxylase gamma subunit